MEKRQLRYDNYKEIKEWSKGSEILIDEEEKVAYIEINGGKDRVYWGEWIGKEGDRIWAIR